MKVQNNQKVEAPDLIFEQKISPTPSNREHKNNSIHEGFTPKASSKRLVSNKRGLQARYNGDLQQEPASSLDILGSAKKDDLIVTAGS